MLWPGWNSKVLHRYQVSLGVIAGKESSTYCCLYIKLRRTLGPAGSVGPRDRAKAIVAVVLIGEVLALGVGLGCQEIVAVIRVGNCAVLRVGGTQQEAPTAGTGCNRRSGSGVTPARHTYRCQMVQDVVSVARRDVAK